MLFQDHQVKYFYVASKFYGMMVGQEPEGGLALSPHYLRESKLLNSGLYSLSAEILGSNEE